MPPLHRIEVVGGKRGEVHYTYSDDEMKKMTADLTRVASAGKNQFNVIKVWARWMQINFARPQWTQHIAPYAESQ
jgi:hypothetical protein